MNKVEMLIAERKSTVEQELQSLIVKCNTLKRERDEARRMLCEEWAKQDGLPLDWQGRRGAEGMAEFVGWDCFKENTND